MTTDSARATLPSPIPAYLDYSRDIGPAPSTTTIAFRVYLAGRDPEGERRFALAVSTPGSSVRGRYLEPDVFDNIFGASRAQRQAVTRWLAGNHLRVTGERPDYINVSGSAPAISTAFDTSIHRFGGAGDGVVGYAPVQAVSVPTAIRTDLTSVLGLDAILYQQGNTARSQSRDARTPGIVTSSAQDCSHWWGEHRTAIPGVAGQHSAPTSVCGYTPQQLRTAYGVRPHDGAGSTIAVVLDGAVPTMRTDADRFFAAHHLAGFSPGQYIENRGTDFASTCGSYADVPEEPFDIETVHIIAPAAKIVYVAASCSNDAAKQQLNFLDAETRIVEEHLADVQTDSFSTREDAYSDAMTAAWTQILEQGAAEGIGFDFDSGDNGDLTTPADSTPSVLFPASDPWATAVGGTTMELSRTGSTQRELPWGDTVRLLNDTRSGYLNGGAAYFADGTTGGRSDIFPEPDYQRARVPRAVARGHQAGAARVVPDVSANASPISGWLIGYTADDGSYEEHVEGGTSGSSPIFAAVQSASQSRTGHPVGFANPALYTMTAGSIGAADLQDIIAPSPSDLAITQLPNCYTANGPEPVGGCVVSLGSDTSLTATSGYDPATGLGAVGPHTADAFGRRQRASRPPADASH